MSESIKSLLGETLVPAGQKVLGPLHEFLGGLPPAVWRGSVCLFLVVGVLWTLFLRKESIFRGAPSGSRWCDLRVWASLLLVPYLLIYLVF